MNNKVLQTLHGPFQYFHPYHLPLVDQRDCEKAPKAHYNDAKQNFTLFCPYPSQASLQKDGDDHQFTPLLLHFTKLGYLVAAEQLDEVVLA